MSRLIFIVAMAALLLGASPARGQIPPGAQTFPGTVGAVPTIGCRNFTAAVSGIPLPAYVYAVRLTIIHTWDSDLSISLVAPSGATIDLSSNNGDIGDNYTDTVFRRDATTSIVAGTPPFTGNFLPEQSFTGLDGTNNVNGDWTLRICDRVATDDGTLINWSITVGQPTTTQSITFGAQGNQRFSTGGTFPINPLATASSGLPVTYSVTTPAICSLTGTTVTMIAPGTCTLAANQAGNANFLAAPTVTQSVTLGALVSRTEIRSSANPAAFGASVTFTATVTGAVAPRGTVQFFDASELLCDGVPVSGGEATCQAAGLSEGGHSIRAAYAGDGILLSSTSDELAQIVPRVGVHQGAWWGGPAENGWGLSIIEQGNTLVAGWYFFDAGGRPTWLIVPGCAWNANKTVCSGNLQQSTASWFGNYRASTLASRIVGTATFSFNSAEAGRFDYTVDGVSGSKAISRMALGAAPDAFDPTNVWSGGASENGWGVSLFSAGNALAGVWYTYDTQGQPTWFLFNNGRSLNPAVYGAQLVRASGAPMIGATYDPNRLRQDPVGEIFFQFLDRNRSVAEMGYLVDGLNQGKAIRKLRF